MSKEKKSFKVEIEFEPMKGMGGGFRSEWLSGENSEIEAGIDSGAGLGNPLMTFWFRRKPGGERVYFTSNMQKLFEAAIEKAKAES